MAAGRAQAIYSRTGQHVCIVDHAGRPRWHPLWDGNPYLSRELAPGVYRLQDCPGHRPYIAGVQPGGRVVWRRWPPSPATVVLSDEEDAFGRQHAGAIVIEDGLKPEATRNKQYPAWPALLRLLPPDVLRVRDLNVDIRRAAAVVKHCRAYVGHEGALHHLAAAFGRPAVVIMGGYVGPAQTGYALANHRYLTGGAQPCGHRSLCEHCSLAMRAITPQAVVAALEEVTT